MERLILLGFCSHLVFGVLVEECFDVELSLVKVALARFVAVICE